MSKQSMVLRVLRADGDKVGKTTVIASTDTPDRYQDVVDQDWRLDDFRANPVILWGHDYGQPPIGKASRVDVQNGTLVADIEWDMGSDLGAQVARQFHEGFLNAVSVGFRPSRAVPRASLGEDDPRFGERGYVYYGNQLLEISAVTIPANPEALSVRDLGDAPEHVQSLVKVLMPAIRDLIRDELREVRGLLETTQHEVRELEDALIDRVIGDVSSGTQGKGQSTQQTQDWWASLGNATETNSGSDDWFQD